MEKINFENGTKVKSPYVVIDDIEHEVVPGEYTGNTPVSARTLNLMQDNIENEINNISKSYDMLKNSSMTDKQTYTLVAEYNLSGNYRDLVDVILFSCTQGNSNAFGSCLLEVSIRKNVNNNNILVRLNILCGRITDVDFYAITNYDETTNNINVKLYVYNNSDYKDVHGKSMSFKSNNSVTRQYYTSENYSTALPSGTQVVASGANEKGELQYNSNITDVDVNNWVRTGNVVQVSFRGLVGTDIANSSRLLLLPFRSAREGTPFVFAGTRYTQKTPVFTWMDNVNSNLNCAPITAGNYVHVYFTYICKD